MAFVSILNWVLFEPLLTFAAISVMLLVGGMNVIEGKMTAGELGAFVFFCHHGRYVCGNRCRSVR